MRLWFRRSAFPRSSPMKNRLVFPLLAALMFCGMTAILTAQTNNEPVAAGKGRQDASGRVDLKTETWVGKKLEGIDEPDEPGGKRTYRYTYRVHAKATEKNMPRFSINPQFNVSYEQTGFLENDSISLRSTNSESLSESPIWTYDVSYSGGGTRSLNFSTSGSAMSLSFSAANSETPDEEFHCRICNHREISQCTLLCRCCCATGDENCNCLGCQYQNPRCFACPVGCDCDHCVCSCDGCLTQNPRCLVCPVGCNCDHCQCLCDVSIDHPGRCGCAACKQRPLICDCECHRVCP